ncbi:hypothetical protein [Sphaerotilus sp.]|uniref:hypothetical protein n=1 Tax=Sphaerotilus sp. TaxID=2093942 RepID=UPI002ACDF08E|nr:hypothetical protein [Sphaerotilus sp.]MDZ7858203.1 hypothetical protein [Sphaerotilus sp.]
MTMTAQARLLMFAPLLSALLSAVLWVLLSGGAAQAALPDPTRPPAGLASALPDAAPPPVRMGIVAPVEGSAAAARPQRPAPAVAVAVPRVQALQFPSDTRSGSPSALIDGRLVRTGDRLGDATVQEIRPDGVWLRLSRGGTQWLGLFTLVEAPAADPLTANAHGNTTAPGQNAPRKEP